MALNLDVVREQATLAVQQALAGLYDNADSDAMKGFAAAIAEAAVVAVRNVIEHAEVEQNGSGIH
jgi:hypothetical protein